jgi:carbonic anhydrase
MGEAHEGGNEHVDEIENLSSDEALARLKAGNERYLRARTSTSDISPELREQTAAEGQRPYAIVLACSDSRVIPEAIFSANIGDLFVIRVAGNIVDNHQMGSIEYADEHLGCHLVVVLGHTGCGAVEAAMHHELTGNVKFIGDEIAQAIDGEKDEAAATLKNIEHSVQKIKDRRDVLLEDEEFDLRIVGALYHTDTGLVEFL